MFMFIVFCDFFNIQIIGISDFQVYVSASNSVSQLSGRPTVFQLLGLSQLGLSQLGLSAARSLNKDTQLGLSTHALNSASQLPTSTVPQLQLG